MELSKVSNLRIVLANTLFVLAHAGSLDVAFLVHIAEFNNLIRNEEILIGPIQVSSKIYCASLCLANPECGSFFFIKESVRLCQLHSVFFPSTAAAVSRTNSLYYKLTQDICPSKEGYVLHRAHALCYRYSTDRAIWGAGKQACERESSHLLFVPSSGAFDHIKNFLIASEVYRYDHVAIGAEYVGSQWRWTDGSLISWTNWASGEPSHASETCVSMAWFYYFQWNDIPCSSDPIPYLCERDLGS